MTRMKKQQKVQKKAQQKTEKSVWDSLDYHRGNVRSFIVSLRFYPDLLRI